MRVCRGGRRRSVGRRQDYRAPDPHSRNPWHQPQQAPKQPAASQAPRQTQQQPGSRPTTRTHCAQARRWNRRRMGISAPALSSAPRHTASEKYSGMAATQGSANRVHEKMRRP